MRPTSRTRKPRAVKDEATALHSKIIRATKGPWCQNECGRPAQDAAHIVSRGPAHTRTDLENAYALCKQCHGHFGLYQSEWMDFIDRTIGLDELRRLEQKARAGVGVKFDWYDELDRLRALAESLGVAA